MTIDTRLAKNWFTKTYKKVSYLSEDFSQYYAEQILKGRKAGFRFIAVDFLREHGPYRSSKSRSDAMNSLCDLIIEPDHNAIYMDADTTNRFDFDRVLSCLDPLDRVLLFLWGRYGYENKEIAKMFGLSESRISQKLQVLQKRIQAIVSRSQQRDREQEGQGSVSENIQILGSRQGSPSEVLERIPKEKRQRVDTTKVKDVSKTLCTAFGVNTF